MAHGTRARSCSMTTRAIVGGFVVGVAWNASAVAGQGRQGQFTDGARLKDAVEICLRDDPTGGCDCAAIGGCGEGGDFRLPEWDVTGVEDFADLFAGRGDFDQNLDGWNVAAATSMLNMFNDATSFTHDLMTWNTANVVEMSFMFRGAQNFDGDISNWNTAKVEAMEFMFDGAPAFNKDLGKWDVSSVTTMASMFSAATRYNYNMTNWNTAKVQDMSFMFNNINDFDSDVTGWNTGAVTTMESMFASCNIFNRNISAWDVSRVTNMKDMFQFATEFAADISSWNTASVTDMSNMFYEANRFTADITGWDSRSVVSSNGMFDSPSTANGNLDPMRWYYKFMRKDNVSATADPNGPPTQWYQWCNNAAGTYAGVVETDCVPGGQCPFPERCPAGNIACIGSTGDLCATCLDGYYKQGDNCFVCPDNSVATAGIAAAFVVLASYVGFKAAAVLGPVSTNMVKKIVDTMQFFSITFTIDIEWPTPIQKFAKWVSAFNFNLDLVAPECAGMKLSWYAIFWSTTFFVPVVLVALFSTRALYAKKAYDKTVEAIRSESDGERTTYWIESSGFCGGERRAYASENGDKIVAKLQKLYAYTSKLRRFATLVLTVFYLPIIRAAIQSFDCVGDSDILMHDVSVKCSAPAHYATQAYAALLVVVYGGGLPFYIYREVRKICVSGKLDDAQTLDTYGSLYEIYRRGELTEAERLEIKQIAANATGMGAASLRRQATLTRAPTRQVELDAETRAVVETITAEEIKKEEREEEHEEEQEVATKPMKKAKSSVASKFQSMMKRSASARGRDRAERMQWKDIVAVNFLTFELAQKFLLVMVSTVESFNGSEDRWGGLLFVHWFMALVTFICQPWRIVTLGIGRFKLNNALNRVECVAAAFQGLVLLVGGTMDDSATKSAATGLLFALITSLLLVRTIFLLAISITEKLKGKLDFIKKPEESMNQLAEGFVKLALEGSTVGIYALKGASEQLRSKERARLESTRTAMLKQIENLKAAGATDKAHINALYVIANEMAVNVNIITVADPPKGPSPQERLDGVLITLDNTLAAIERNSTPETVIHDRLEAYRAAVDAALEHAHLYARAEMIPELSEIAQGIRPVIIERDNLSIGFNNHAFASS